MLCVFQSADMWKYSLTHILWADLRYRLHKCTVCLNKNMRFSGWYCCWISNAISNSMPYKFLLFWITAFFIEKTKVPGYLFSIMWTRLAMNLRIYLYQWTYAGLRQHNINIVEKCIKVHCEITPHNTALEYNTYIIMSRERRIRYRF